MTGHPTRIDITGKRFGRLTALSFHHVGTKSKQAYWNCQCDCGQMTVCRASDLRSGKTKSCGCLKLEAHSVHGMRYTRTYKSWNTMRWQNKGDVCERWSDYGNFFDDMGVKPPGHALWRIDKALPFCKDNCEWLPLLEVRRRSLAIGRDKQST